MISCNECQSIVDQFIQTNVDVLFDSTITEPDHVHGFTEPCSNCGRTWTLVCHTLSYGGDSIPEGAVLTELDKNNASELSELEAQELMHSYIEEELQELLKEEGHGS